ncbi:MAG: hypothetical protein QOJ12_3040 [Thermoleophilales bacterium]|nr:hypothetical protein [Thermoleophilales bacterium]
MLAVVDAYSVSVFLHVAAVVVGFGSTYALAVTFPVAMTMGTRYLPYVHQLGLVLNRWFATPALVIILATGIYQVSSDGGRGWSFSDGWISGAFVILIILGGMIGGYFVPSERKLLAMAERDLATGSPEMSPEYTAAVKRSGMVGALAGVLILLAVFLMVTKPGA